jgi:flagellar assembly factor FliW
MKYDTTRFGPVDLEDNQIIHFKDGLYGFEGQDLFGVLPFNADMESPLEWLQSLTVPELAFILADPYAYVPDYSVLLSNEEESQLEVEADHSLLVRVIVTVPRNYQDMTANLLAPIVINLNRKKGRQVILTNKDYDTRHLLISQEARQAELATE